MSPGGSIAPILRDGFVPILRHASQLSPRTAPMTIRFAYNTNGTAHHRLMAGMEAIEIPQRDHAAGPPTLPR